MMSFPLKRESRKGLRGEVKAKNGFLLLQE
jgi:hypothetical protein